jgi:hypothetical protein
LSGRLEPDLERIALRVVELMETRAAVAHRQRTEHERVALVAEVSAYLAAHPDASSRDVSRALRRRRQRVLDVMRELQAAETRLPSPGNHLLDATEATP